MTAETLPPRPPTATIRYKNWRGEVAERRVVPIRIWFGHTDWHKEEQWLMTAFDVDKQTERDFALRDIQEWLR